MHSLADKEEKILLRYAEKEQIKKKTRHSPLAHLQQDSIQTERYFYDSMPK